MSNSDPAHFYGINMNAFQIGVLMQTIWKSENRDVLMDVFKQLHEFTKRQKRDDSVIVREHDNGTVVELLGASGYHITRPKYEWEYELGIV